MGYAILILFLPICFDYNNAVEYQGIVRAPVERMHNFMLENRLCANQDFAIV